LVTFGSAILSDVCQGREMLANWGATQAEIDSALPGDDLIDGPAHVGTRAIDIAAEPATVFDFLAQMGLGRAGWYSYDLLDNLGRKSATTIHDEWLVRSAGETVPGGPIHFVAAIVERPSAYALKIPPRRLLGYTVGFTLAYQLNPTARGTRVVSRARINIAGPAGGLLTQALMFGDGLMVRRQLLGLKARCESLS